MNGMIDLMLAVIGDEPPVGTETVEMIAVDGEKSTTVVPDPCEFPEVTAAFNESIRRALPIRNGKFNRYMAVLLVAQQELARTPALWKRYKDASDLILRQRMLQG